MAMHNDFIDTGGYIMCDHILKASCVCVCSFEIFYLPQLVYVAGLNIVPSVDSGVWREGPGLSI